MVLKVGGASNQVIQPHCNPYRGELESLTFSTIEKALPTTKNGYFLDVIIVNSGYQNIE